MKIALAQLNPTIGDLEKNTDKIIGAIEKAKDLGSEVVLFSELALTGYPPEDLLTLPSFLQEVEKKIDQIQASTQNICAIVGYPRCNRSTVGKPLFNSAVILQNGQVIGYHDKILLPTYDVFDERRYFEPGRKVQTWIINGKRLAVTICEDIWQHAHLDPAVNYSIDPIQELIKQPPDLLLNLSASPYNFNKRETRHEVCLRAAVTLDCPVLLCNQVGANDSLIFDGYSLQVNPKGGIQSAKGFEEDILVVDSLGFNSKNFCKTKIEDLHDALIMGVRDYFHKQGFYKGCLGISGGIDSALVAYLAVQALGPKNVTTISMPSRYSSEETKEDARLCAQILGTDFHEISIESPFESFLATLQPYFIGMTSDITEENLQARIRGVLLMAFSNKFGAIVLNAGNKSELAMGYSTLYGDMCGGLAVIGDLYKSQVYALSRWINRKREIIPTSIIERAPSAELRPNQKDSDSLPDYGILDPILEAYIEKNMSSEAICELFGCPKVMVDELILRIHRNEYKRRQGAPVLRVTSKSFTVGRRFPIVQGWIE